MLLANFPVETWRWIQNYSEESQLLLNKTRVKKMYHNIFKERGDHEIKSDLLIKWLEYL